MICSDTLKITLSPFPTLDITLSNSEAQLDVFLGISYMSEK